MKSTVGAQAGAYTVCHKFSFFVFQKDSDNFLLVLPELIFTFFRGEVLTHVIWTQYVWPTFTLLMHLIFYFGNNFYGSSVLPINNSFSTFFLVPLPIPSRIMEMRRREYQKLWLIEKRSTKYRDDKFCHVVTWLLWWEILPFPLLNIVVIERVWK